MHAVNGGVPGYSGGVAFYGLPYMNGAVPNGDSLAKINKPVMMFNGAKDTRTGAPMPAVDSAMKALEQVVLRQELPGRHPRIRSRTGRSATAASPRDGGRCASRGASESRCDQGGLAADGRLPQEKLGDEVVATGGYGFEGTVTSFSGDIPSASAWKFTTTRWREHRNRHRVHVLEIRHRAAVHRGARLGAEDEVLRRARSGAPAHVLLHERRRLFGAGARRARELDGVAHDRRRRGKAAHEVLQLRGAARRRAPAGSRRRDRRSSRRRSAPPRRGVG